MYELDLMESISRLEKTRTKRMKQKLPLLSSEEKYNLLHKFHPDYKSDARMAVRIGPNKGESLTTKVSELLESHSRINPDDIDLCHVDYDVDVLIIGGGGGGSSGDEKPPQISNLEVKSVTEYSAVICWTTDEASTNQVKYWASPEMFSPLDETRVTNHVVELTDLQPSTIYQFTVISRDRYNNLEESEVSTFTTLGEPATFTLSSLRINPTEAEIGEPVNISLIVTNIGNAAGRCRLNISRRANIRW